MNTVGAVPNIPTDFSHGAESLRCTHAFANPAMRRTTSRGLEHSEQKGNKWSYITYFGVPTVSGYILLIRTEVQTLLTMCGASCLLRSVAP